MITPLIPWLRNTIIVLVLFEIFYLGLINLALSLPVTQTLINQIKPDKFAVSWEKAWSWYPFRVHATGVSANGQSKGQQWQVDAPSASASISLIPLIWKTVSLSGAEATDVVFHLRPRPREGKDYSKIQPYFAPIKNRQLETEPAPVVAKKKGKKAWDISVDGIHASGNHSVWIFQLQAKLKGELEADINFQTRGGPFSLENGELDVDLDSIVINGDREVVRDGHIKGSLAFAPFVPKENKGIKVLDFLSLDADIRTETESLAYLNYYLQGFNGMEVSGRGNIDGHLSYHNRRLAAGNKLLISANELAVDLFNYRAQGEGEVSLEVSEAEPDVLAFEIKFSELDGLHSESKEVLVTGEGLSFSGRGRTQIIAADSKESIASYLAVNIPSIKVPDLALYQRFLPERGSFKLLGGEGELEAKAELTQFGFTGFSRLSSKAADISVKDFQFSADLDMNLNVDAPKLAATGVDVSGTYIHIDNARLSSEEVDSVDPWTAAIDIEKGRVKLVLPEGVSTQARLGELLAGVKGKEILPMLDSDSEQLKIRGVISDLRWLNVLMKNRFNLAIRGAGDISAELVLDSGWMAPGTEFNINPKKLIVEVLDYVATGGGGGHLRLAVEKGGESPDVSLDIKMTDASFKNKDDEQSFVEDTDILLQALARNITFDGKGRDVDLHLQIPSAQVKDLSVYNSYLPPDSPLQIVDGQAELKVDVLLKPESAGGFVKLISTGMHAMADKQEVEADMNIDIKLVGGVPQNMDFDISGSTIEINNVKVTGDKKDFNDDNWGVLLSLNKARAVWKQPVQLDIEADLGMTDSRPFVAMIANKKDKEGWLAKAMTIDDVKGKVNMRVNNRIIVIPYAFAGSDNIDVGAKAIVSADARNGVLYARFRKLHGLLKFNNGKRNLDILKARKKFDEYVPSESKLKPEK
ncbi:MAG: hypothetical protein U9N50_05020 [Pseudomonadota bacterium]|nr:hypothetical protein [Pseudomonadota bacterium]